VFPCGPCARCTSDKISCERDGPDVFSCSCLLCSFSACIFRKRE
jgi:hypothetical protein